MSARKIVASVLLSIFLLTSVFVPVARAQSAGLWYTQEFPQWYVKVYGGGSANEIFGERYTAAQVQWVFYGFISMIVNALLSHTGCTSEKTANILAGNLTESICLLGSSNTSGQQYATISNSNKNILSNIFADRPLSGITYFKDLIRKFHIIPEVKAQSVGFGFNALEPVRQLWTASRNISYTLFVLVTLILAFMIMFRVKLSPQVAVTVQSALPRIVVAIIFVTFSYAIAGFLIDMMYVVIGLISLIFSSTKLLSDATGDTGVTAMFYVFTQGLSGQGIWGFLFLYLIQFFSTLVVVGVGLGYGLLAGLGTVGGAVGAGIGGALFILIAIVVAVLMVFVLLWMSLKIIWTLIKAFAYVLFLTIILPLQITFGIVVPSIGIGSWLKLYIANLAVFPITGTLFALAFIFMEMSRRLVEDYIKKSQLGAFVNAPPASLAPGWPPLLGTGAGTMSLVFLMASFFIISLVPKAAEVANSLITGKGFNFGSAIGEALGPITGPTRFATGAVGKVVQEPLGKYIVGKGRSIFTRPEGGTPTEEAVERAGEPEET